MEKECMWNTYAIFTQFGFSGKEKADANVDTKHSHNMTSRTPKDDADMEYKSKSSIIVENRIVSEPSVVTCIKSTIIVGKESYHMSSVHAS